MTRQTGKKTFQYIFDSELSLTKQKTNGSPLSPDKQQAGAKVMIIKAG